MPVELRREDRADRARVDRAVGVAAGALVDRADVQAGRAADAVQRLRARPRRRATSVRPLSSRTRWNSCGPSPGVTPVQIEVYGFIRSPVDERGSSCRNTSRSRQRGHELLDAHDRDQRLGQGQAHPAVALGLDDARACRSRRRRSWRRETATLARQELLAQVRAGPPRPARRGSSVRSAGSTSAISRRKMSRISARLRWIAGTRMCDGRSCAELDDQLGEVGLAGGDARRPRGPR